MEIKTDQEKKIDKKKTFSNSDEAYYPLPNDEKKGFRIPKVALVGVLVGCIGIGVIGFRQLASQSPSHPVQASEKLAKNDGTMSEFFQTFDEHIDVLEKNPNTDLSTKTKEKFKRLASNVIHTPALKTSGAKAAEISEYVVVSKCYIDGHDIHFLSLSGEIISHVPMGTPLSGLVARAREIISLNPQISTRIIVLKDRLQVFTPSGELLSEERLEAKK